MVGGSEAGTVFSHSILDIGVDGPLVVLANGTTVEWSQGNPVYSENSLISTSGRCSILSILNVLFRFKQYSQLGLGNSVSTSGYIALSHEPVVVDEGKDHTCAILLDASLWCWGRNHFGRLETTQPMMSISCEYRPRKWRLLLRSQPESTTLVP